MKAKRKGLAANSKRTPTVRRVTPSIAPVARPKAQASLGPRPAATGAAGSGAPSGPAAPALAATSLDLLGGRPIDLTVDLGRGLVLDNPVIVASGPFGYGVEVADLVDLPRLGAIVTRSTSLKPRAGHPAPRVAEVPAGLLLGMGPQNAGIDMVLERYADAWARWPVPVILSLCADTSGELGEVIRRIEGAPGIAGIEINLSCGSGRGGVPGLDADSAGSSCQTR